MNTKLRGTCRSRAAPARPAPATPAPARRVNRTIFCPWSCEPDNETAAEDVIDLGAPRLARRTRCAGPPARRDFPPNPRLYPGPKPKHQPRVRRERSGPHRNRRAKHKLRPVPNSRLYRPAPPRATPPPRPAAAPRAAWPRPPPPRVLETASHAALQHLAAPAPPSAPSRLVVTLPMERASPDLGDASDTEPISAPSEFLAEFLSAIMQRQYAEALKYCRLILQYEPHNATARGFFPLLQHRARHSASASASASASTSPSPRSSPASASPRWSPAPSRCGSSASGSAPDWDSSGSAPPPPDANGNPSAPRTPLRRLPLTADDVENDNASAGGEPHCSLKSEASAASLRRLRAQFACSIK